MSKPEPETLGVPQEFNVLDTAINRERANPVSDLTGQGNASFNEIKARRNRRVSGIQGKGAEKLGATQSYDKGAKLLRARGSVNDD